MEHKIFDGKPFLKIWAELANIPVNENEEIEAEFYGIEIGTNTTDVWHMIESHYKISIGRYVDGLPYKEGQY